MNIKKIHIWIILLGFLSMTTLGCSITNLIGDQLKELVEDQIPDADEIQDLVQDIPGDVEDLIPADIDELIPADIDELIPADIDELIPADADELIPADVDELIPEDIDELIPDELDQGSTQNVPIPENATNMEEISGIITFASPDDTEQVAEFYRQKLPAEGWNITNDQTFGPFVTISAGKEGDSVEIVINPGMSSGTTVIITSMIP